MDLPYSATTINSMIVLFIGVAVVGGLIFVGFLTKNRKKKKNHS